MVIIPKREHPRTGEPIKKEGRTPQEQESLSIGGRTYRNKSPNTKEETLKMPGSIFSGRADSLYVDCVDCVTFSICSMDSL